MRGRNGLITLDAIAQLSDRRWCWLTLHSLAWQFFSGARTMRRCATLATIVGFAVCESLGGVVTDAPLEGGTDRNETKWEFSLSTFTYLAQHQRDYVNPIFTADRDWLHLEARYNYEELKTGSVWFGYNFDAGEKLKLEVTPMVGGVFGDITGIAPGYTITLGYKSIEWSMKGEYFFDARRRSNDFFYNWAEVSASPANWFRIGIVIERTQASAFSSDIQLGPLIGFKYKGVDLTTYWLGPGSDEATFVFAVTFNF